MQPIVLLSASAALGLSMLAPNSIPQTGSGHSLLYASGLAALAETPQEQLARLQSEYEAALQRATRLSAELDAKLAEVKSSTASYDEKQAMLANLKLMAKQAQAAQSDAAYKKLNWEMAQSQLGDH